MIIYKDLFSGDEMISDSFPFEDIDGIAIKITSKTIKQGAADYDIGANPSAEGGDEDGGGGSAEDVFVNNVEDAFKYQEMALNKKNFMAYLKDYLKKVKAHLEEHNPDRVAEFQAGSQKFIKEKILANFADFQFYCGESMDPEAGMAYKFYEGENPEPFFYVFKDGLVEEKC
mmetsp:Transcript_34302/g.80176  ORF Transcript_34302/g.80176 Transcript_34302/m.80176 type:complete len:172 (-) Transcript_34302:44-559(-)|eukprot:CAMPEP_0117024546 /NCGR_PEP_ID=MMETSP0472-20121206/18216_1 /TAXON_ID=693140 ORGANISM="Tiarina fusus, Strain LIS" /NCGR_SAMPLE_ID=MMETSP0472 /ASSEMBLY_ACC=CAM_ASM_000603 /LENGTH=171 /DNA_ID=CAMNT_0004731003 /DNA_START=69 /DNA_END=584 /DNA_ORIENTATION=-